MDCHRDSKIWIHHDARMPAWGDKGMPKRPKRPSDDGSDAIQIDPASETPENAAELGKLKRRRGPRPGTENARHGGLAVREKYGPEFFAKIGAKGGKSVSAQHSADFYAGIGHRGGSSTRDRLGVEHYERIGRMGGLRQRQRERDAEQGQPPDNPQSGES